MKEMAVMQDFIFLSLSGQEQIAICSSKAEKADRNGDNNEALNWFIKGLNLAREQSNEVKIREFTQYILTLI